MFSIQFKVNPLLAVFFIIYGSIFVFWCNMCTAYAIIVFFFVEYLTEDSRRRSKHVAGLTNVCMSLYLIVVQL
jgi:uncharacterized membrane protein YozB (DUF420 family)